jgi:hypothetical protein
VAKSNSSAAGATSLLVLFMRRSFLGGAGGSVNIWQANSAHNVSQEDAAYVHHLPGFLPTFFVGRFFAADEIDFDRGEFPAALSFGGLPGPGA